MALGLSASRVCHPRILMGWELISLPGQTPSSLLLKEFASLDGPQWVEAKSSFSFYCKGKIRKRI